MAAGALQDGSDGRGDECPLRRDQKIERPKVLYSWYATRGDETENRIKDLMLALKADRV